MSLVRSLNIQRQQIVIIAILFVLLMILSMPLVLAQPSRISPDAVWYLNLGLNIYQGKGFVDEANQIVVNRTAFYPVLLATSFNLFGVSLSSAMVVTKSFAVLTLVLAFLLGVRLYNVYIGLITAILVAGVPYLNLFPARLLRDEINAFFMLSTLYLIIQGFERRQRILFALAGISLGLAVLLKQTSILYFPLPLLLFLFINKYRFWQIYCLKNFVVYWLSAIGVMASWWIYTFIKTGQIYLIQGRGYEFLSAPVLFIILSTCLGLGIYFWPKRWYVANLIHFVSKQQKRKQSLRGVYVLFGVGTLFSFQVMIWFEFGQTLSSLPFFLMSVPQFFVDTVNGIGDLAPQPLLIYAPWAWLLVTILATRGSKPDRVLIITGLLYLPPFLLVSSPSSAWFGPRHVIILHLLSYLVLGRSIFWIIKLVEKYLVALSVVFTEFFRYRLISQKELKLSGILSWGVVALTLIYSLSQGFLFLFHHNSRNQYDNRGWVNYATLNVSKWLVDYVPPETPLMSTLRFGRSIHFLTEGRYAIHEFPFKSIKLFQENENTPHHQWSDFIFIENRQQAYYNTLSEKDFLEELKRLKIEYLLVTEGSINPKDFPFEALPLYFMKHPAFEVVYSESIYTETIYVFKINETRLQPKSYPLVMSSNTLLQISKDIEKLKMSEYDLVHSLVNGGIQVKPESEEAAEAYIMLGNVYRKYGDIQTGFDFYKLAVNIKPESLPVPYRTQALTLWQEQATSDVIGATALGKVYYTMGKINQAIMAFQQAVALNPTDSQLNLDLAKAYLAKGQLTEDNKFYIKAIDTNKKVLTLDPENKDVLDKILQIYLILGAQYHKQSLTSKAILAYDEVIKLDPNNRDAKRSLIKIYVTLGDQHVEQNMPLRASVAYEKVIALDPNQQSIYWKLAKTYETLGRLDEAADLYRHISKRWPANAEAYYQVAKIFEIQGDLVKTIAEYETAIKLNPTFVAAYTHLGELYKNHNRIEEAISLYELASVNNPHAAWPHIQLGKIYLEQTNSD